MELSKVQDEAQGSQKAGHLEAAAYSFDTFEEAKKFLILGSHLMVLLEIK